MSGETIFDAFDPETLAIATDHFAATFIRAQLGSTRSICGDPRITPLVLVAGLCKAHALGLMSALASAGRVFEGAPTALASPETRTLQADLLDACVATIRVELARENAGREMSR